jgi:hypothetical protein
MAASDRDASPTTQICEEDRPFSHYSLKHTVIAWVSQSLFDRFTYTVGHG